MNSPVQSTFTHPTLNLEQTADRYVGFFANALGERWIFVAERDNPVAHLTGADLDWQVLEVTEPDEARKAWIAGLPEVLAANVCPLVGDLILDREERQWLELCWHTTSWLRTGESSSTEAAPVVDAEALGREFGRANWIPELDAWQTSNDYRDAMRGIYFYAGRVSAEQGVSLESVQTFMKGVHAGLKEASAAAKTI